MGPLFPLASLASLFSGPGKDVKSWGWGGVRGVPEKGLQRALALRVALLGDAGANCLSESKRVQYPDRR